MTVDNQSSAVTYKEIMPDTDFEYIVTSNSIKENIVVYEPQSEYIYSFDMDFDGLTPVINPDNSISLIEPNNPDETIFFIEAPYMYDSNNAESIDIEMSLVSNSDEYVMTLIASAEWINSSERVFPIVIDPTIQLLNSSISDVFVIDGLYADSPRIKNELRVGRNLANVTRTYIKMTLPENVPEGSIVNSASLTLKKDDYFQALLADDVSVQVYDCCNVGSWNIDTISWNNQPFNNSDNGYKSTSGAIWLSSISANSDRSSYSFNITAAVQRWINKGTNNGLMLASSNESSKTQVDFYSSRVSNESNRPTMSFSYVPSGIDKTSWNTTSEAGTSTEIKVTASKEWIATTNQSWLTVSPSNGTGESSFTITATENTSITARTGIVVVTSGSTVIGTVNVIQSGANADIIVEKNEMLFDCKDGSQTISVISNVPWNVSVDSESSSWLNAFKDDSGNIGVTVSSKTDIGERSGRVIVNAENGTDTEIITVTQLDYINYYFSETDENGSIINKSSSEYNHLLAQWSMALSYAAYNPIKDQFLPLIPSSFMQAPYDDESNTAKADLLSNGFEVTEYNYDEDSDLVAAHTIGHREIVFNENLEQNIIGGNNNDRTSESTFYYSGDIVNADHNGNRGSGTGQSNVSTISTGSDYESLYVTDDISETSDAESNNIKQLVVVVVRGSVTYADWAMNLATQFNTENDKFYDGMEMVYNSLYGYDDCTECNGSDANCACNGYLALNGITDPVFLVTGHSLGAAIANLLAERLNSETAPNENEIQSNTTATDDGLILGKENIYAYTFATPNVVDTSISGEEKIKYSNIFNILNTNDVVPCVPRTLDFENWDTSTWARHGRDFYITMPLDIDWLSCLDTALTGLGGHAMPTYYTWINCLAGELGKDPENITTEDLVDLSEDDVAYGLLTRWLKVNCPVSVTLYDSNGNIVAYESQQESAEYPNLTESGVVSWITDEGEKVFVIPYGSEAIDVHIEAYDYGTMEVTVEQPGIGEPLNTVTYNNVNLYPDKEFLVEVSEDILPEDTQLFVTEDGEIVGEVIETEPPFKSITVDYNNITYGTAIHLTIVTDNTVSEINLHNRTRGTTKVLVPGGVYVQNVTSDGDNLIWTVGYYPLVGENVYDISVKSGESWHYYENVIAISVSSNT